MVTLFWKVRVMDSKRQLFGTMSSVVKLDIGAALPIGKDLNLNLVEGLTQWRNPGSTTLSQMLGLLLP